MKKNRKKNVWNFYFDILINYFIYYSLFGIRVVSVSYDKNINYVICTFNWNFRKSPNKNKNFRKCMRTLYR